MERILGRTLKIVRVQTGLTYGQIAKQIGINKTDLLTAVGMKYHPSHKAITDFLLKNFDIQDTSLRVMAALYGVSLREYCKRVGVDYYEVIE